MKIAVDAMGGDFAPGVVIEGVLMALQELPGIQLILVGHKDKLAYYLEKAGIDPMIRGEKLTIEEFGRLADAVCDRR